MLAIRRSVIIVVCFVCWSDAFTQNDSSKYSLRRVSFGLEVSGSVTGKTKIEGNDYGPHVWGFSGTYYDSKFNRPKFGYGARLTSCIKIRKNFSFSTGFGYDQMGYQTTIIDTLTTGYGGIEWNTFPPEPSKTANFQGYRFHFNFLSAPLGFDYHIRLKDSRVFVNVGGGATFRYLYSYKVEEKSNGKFVYDEYPSDPYQVFYKRVSVFYNLKCGVNYFVGRKNYIALEPSFDLLFQPQDHLRGKLYSSGLHLRYHF